ncbi:MULTISPECIES: divalent metal ion exporter adaptor subunit IhpB [Bradyrhizobium]|uniref:divalent metal ion exporter adaptor subunit IhpB n=1 Tax=Bradyrhizobium TaxID=374 RepID=UPI001CD67AFA|nr:MULTISPECIES: efflux RND transporter periplasmic adaptor subunit [unclassified Bradyrhizobium]MCA1427145.1 efflux RND transporter periplasmic adaptor subunit [Bradyrhizobium sp. NBAIM16]MCA1505830.1 efflux RND transporter periplasmic adaptor subunit [Bradyrhizobium sp. NBAIM02]MCA1513385.1 efflux RND transporter periplasmic adaptor subunit [Bradyrhizobium sp. NBAIM01]UWU81682.1 efflux RND transporter periplasmic adaptor subunit [Bradyrhizobium sp. CB1024]
MKTSSTILVAIVAAALGAYGYSLLAADKLAHTDHGEHAEHSEHKKPSDHVEQDEHGADRIRISDVKLAAAGVTLAEAASATLTDTLAFNGILRANQEAVVQVTPRFPGLAKSIQKRIGDKVGKDDLLAAIESNQSLTVYELKAPIAGTIIERQISLGEYASEQKPAFVVADLSTIWVDLSIYRQDLRRVRLNDEVLIDPDDGRGEIKGTISYMAPIGSSETQTALARVVLPNPDGRLRPGLFVTARLILAARNVAVAVRRSAIQTLENKTIVFVREDGDKIEARPVETGDSDPRHVEIKAGLSAGEHYVAENSFVVKAEMGKGEAEHD